MNKKSKQEGLDEKILAIPARLIVVYTVPALIKGFDFFNQIAEIGPRTEAKIAACLSVDKRVLGAVISYLLKEGYLEKTEGEKYQLSSAAQELLTREGDFDLSEFTQVYEELVPKQVGDSIIAALRTGQPAKWRVGETWEKGMKSGSLSKSFSEGLMSRGKLLAVKLSSVLVEELAARQKLLDIGGSLGDYCGRFSQDHLHLTCVVFDLPRVVETARENIAAAKYERVYAIGGDMFKDELPKDFDVHLFSSVIHDWSPAENARLLKKSYDSLEDGGLIIIHDLHLNNDKMSPSFAVDHSLAMAVQSNGRCYSYREVADMLRQAGFKGIRTKQTTAGYSVMIGRK